MNGQSLLRYRNFHAAFGTADAAKEVVHGVDLELEAGGSLALVGESGSGKTVTAQAALRLQSEDWIHYPKGEILFDGEDILKMSAERLRSLRGKDIGMIFQEPMTSLNPLHTIEKQLGEALWLHQGIKANRARPFIIESLTHVGLRDARLRLGAYPHELSGGERQRVMIAMALLNKPRLLIADEPTTALDITIQAQILSLIKSIQNEMGLAVLFITHDLNLVKRFAANIAVMKDGVLVESGESARVLNAPEHAYTKQLLHAGFTGAPAQSGKTDAPLIAEAQGLKVYFPVRKGFLRRTAGYIKAVDGIDFTLHTGETLGIAGESGSGKSTLGKALLRLVKSEGALLISTNALHPDTEAEKASRTQSGLYPLPTRERELRPQPEAEKASRTQSGLYPLPTRERALRPQPEAEKVLRTQRELYPLPIKERELRPLRRRMQIIFQDPFGSLSPRMTVRNIVGEGLLIHEKLDAAARDAAVQEALAEVGLDDPAFLNRYPNEFSGGQRQRIAIARSLVLKPEILVLDEPTSGLDRTVQFQVINLLRSLQEKHGMSYLFISHDLSLIKSFCNRLLIMKDGKCVESGDTEEIFKNPQNPYTRRLLEAAHIL